MRHLAQPRPYYILFPLLWCVGVLIAASAAFSQGRNDPGTSQPAQWSAEESDVFFPDAREQLVGDREVAEKEVIAVSNDRSRETAQQSWMSVVDDETLMTEIKRLQISLDRSLNSVASFRAGVHAQCRSDFSMLAVLFRVIAEYDGEVRWKRDATTMKSLCIQAADACRHGTEESFAVAQQARQALEDLLRGQSLRGMGLEADDQGEMTELALLMQRMDRSMKQISGVPSADSTTFRQQAEDIGHEARLIALLAQVIQQEDFYYSGDEDYAEEAQTLMRFARELFGACAAEDQQAASAAVREVTQSCARCHEDYRG